MQREDDLFRVLFRRLQVRVVRDAQPRHTYPIKKIKLNNRPSLWSKKDINFEPGISEC